MSDSKALRRYQAGVERALGLFDAGNEWADYIAFLSRLLKALQAAPPNATVPSKITLAKYLAQCLRPSLPAGVHQKALEVYGVIFSLLGRDGLSEDLPLYLPGISHTLSFASLSTRPWFLALYDEHILKLPPSVLRPALKALILSLLPGIEEENSEDFEKTLVTFNRIRTAFQKDGSEGVFWQSLFLASITSPNRRMGVLVYLFRYLPKLNTSIAPRAEVEAAANGIHASTQVVTTPEPGLLIRCFATGLQDEQPLVQRGFLDLLVTNLPLSSDTLQHRGSANDLDILVSSVLAIVLRRDMSLNRRLWQWFFGADDKASTANGSKSPDDRRQKQDDDDVQLPDPPSATSGSAYFAAFGLTSIVRTFDKIMDRDYATPLQRARPFRILISLMDRSLIGGPVVDALFERLLQGLKTYQTNAPSQEAFDEVFRSANVFFDSIEPRVIVKNMLELFKDNNMDLIHFICSNFSLNDDDMVRHQLPSVAYIISQDLLDSIKDTSFQHSSLSSRQQQIAEVMDLIVVREQNVDSGSFKGTNEIDSSSAELLGMLYQFYEASTTKSDQEVSLSFDRIRLELFLNVSRIIDHCLRTLSDPSFLDHLTSLFEKLFTKSYLQALIEIDFPRRLSDWARESLDLDSKLFSILRNAATLVSSLLFHSQDDLLQSSNDILGAVPILTRLFWQRLNPSTPQHHVESVEAIWALRSLSSSLFLVNSTIMALLSQGLELSENQGHPIVNFGILWTHTKMSPTSSAQVGNGDTASVATDQKDFLKPALLYIIDMTSVDRKSDPCLSWMSSLPSLNVHFRAVIERMRVDDHDTQHVTTGLHRLWKLIKIAKLSAAQWKEFTDARGFHGAVIDLTMSLVASKSRRSDWAESSLELIRMVHDGSEIVLSEPLIVVLTQQISQTEDGCSLQSSILETLQMLVGLSGVDAPPMELLTILMAGIASPTIDANIDKWITLLCNSIPLYSDSVFFTHLLKLTECFCKRTQAYFDTLQAIYLGADAHPKLSSAPLVAENPERSITNLLSGLEYILARAHTKVTEAARPASAGISSNEVPQSRALANNRLTAILCMQDAIKVCGQVWSWRSPSKASVSSESKSFSYMSSRLRARTRRMLEHLINAEPQECLETMMGMWVDAVKKTSQQAFVMSLLESLDGARPKFMMPAIFNAIYGRTNPGALDVDQRSSLSVDVAGLELVAFLLDYVEALEDDLLEEIWSDCTSFLRDILANPMPHRQILLKLLQFLAVLCQKMENTNFGDQSRMRRDLADLCARLFTAIFTIKPAGFDQGSSIDATSKTKSNENFGSGKGVTVIRDVLPAMMSVLGEADRISAISAGISSNITGPLLRSRSFPINISDDVLGLLLIMSKAQSAQKTWRKDVLEAFNDPKFFQGLPDLADSGWVPIIRQLVTLDKALLSDLLSRFSPPATAGIMFGVGASAARAEADKQTKINLRRTSLLLVANEIDAFAPALVPILAKVKELLTATPASSPSASTRGELFLLLRAVSLSCSQNSLIALWPVIDSELRGVFDDIGKGEESVLTPYSHLQAAKLLDVLLLLKPEEFQLHEWLYITDTIDAIYPPSDSNSTALADNLHIDTSREIDLQSTTTRGMRKPWLCSDSTRNPSNYEALLGSFFGHLSIRAFEDTYSLDPTDFHACTRDVLADLFTEGD